MEQAQEVAINSSKKKKKKQKQSGKQSASDAKNNGANSAAASSGNKANSKMNKNLVGELKLFQNSNLLNQQDPLEQLQVKINQLIKDDDLGKSRLASHDTSAAMTNHAGSSVGLYNATACNDIHGLSSPSMRMQQNIAMSSQNCRPTTVYDNSQNIFTIKKGVLWQQQNYDKFHQRLFSRWKKRYFLLTTDYLVCFKRSSSKVGHSEMGKFLYKAMQLAGLLPGQVLLASGKPVQLIDEKIPISIESVATAVCETTSAEDAQISRVSTIAKLNGYFDKQVTNEQHVLYECKQRNMESLQLLNKLLNTSNDNVCSDTKLSLIEDFNKQFVSTHANHVNSRRGENKTLAPVLLQLFFHHYAIRVAITCKKGLINNLEWDLNDKFGDDVTGKLLELTNTSTQDQEIFKANLGHAVSKFTELFSIKQYDDAVLIWDLIQGLYLKQMMKEDHIEKIEDQFDSITGEPIRVLVKLRDVHNVTLFKEKCHYGFKPVYEKLILPTIRLANLGYSDKLDEEFKIELEELRSNAQVRYWYTVTALCEAILPFKFYEDPELKAGAIKVITPREAEELDRKTSESCLATEPQHKIVYEVETNSLAGLDVIESVASEKVRQFVGQVETKLIARDRIIQRTKGHLFKNLNLLLAAARSVHLLISKKETSGGENEFVQEDFSEQFGDDLNAHSEQDLLQMNGAGLGGLERHGIASRGAKGIGARRTIDNDDDLLLKSSSLRTEMVAHERTKSWTEITARLSEMISSLMPSRRQILWFGGALLVLLVLITIVILVSTITVSASIPIAVGK